MASIPRIMVVDTANQLGGIVRSALALLDRRHVLVEIPNAQDALDEVFRTEIDLAVTAYKLDTMNGIDWAERAIREQAGAPIIVAASNDDPGPDPARLKDKPFQYLPYTSGERFLRAVRIGLDGEAVVAAEEGAQQAALDLGPVPPLDVDAARAILNDTSRELRAVGALISDRAGRIVVDQGATGYIDKAQISALLGPTFAHAVKVAQQIGGNGWSLKYYEGERYNLFGLAIGYHYFMMFIVDASDKLAFGAVTRYGRQGANKITELLADGAWIKSQAPSAVGAAQTESAVDTGTATPAEIEQVEAEKRKRSTEEMTAALAAPTLEPIDNLDLDLLFSQGASENGLDDLFEDGGELDLGGDLLESDDSVSYEEAQNMGLLGE
ncbi:MAG: response regulator transcription factor [Chloroflexi bacterium]|nr:response regulator transcription factor [Chloroflexota bacterium]